MGMKTNLVDPALFYIDRSHHFCKAAKRIGLRKNNWLDSLNIGETLIAQPDTDRKY